MFFTSVLRRTCFCVAKAAEDADLFSSEFNAHKKLRELFIPGGNKRAMEERTPLTGSLFASNESMFNVVYQTYDALHPIGSGWTRQQVKCLPYVAIRSAVGCACVSVLVICSMNRVAQVLCVRYGTPVTIPCEKLMERYRSTRDLSLHFA